MLIKDTSRQVLILVPAGWYVEECCVQAGNANPCAALYLAAYLRKKGHSPSVKRYKLDQPFPVSWQTGAVILYAPWNLAAALAFPVFQTLKRWKPDLITILVIYDAFPDFEQRAMELCPAVDYAVLPHEKEISVAAILEHGETRAPGGFGPKAGILCRDQSGAIQQGEARPFAETLDHLPFVGEEYLRYFQENPGSPPGVEQIFTRGCPGQCIFCPLRLTRMRHRSPEIFVEEFLFAQQHCGGGSVTNLELFRHEDLLHSLAQEILRRNAQIPWTTGARADFLRDRELLAQLKASGLRHLYFGIESATAEIREKILKPLSDEMIDSALDAADAAQIPYTMAFIVGFPWENGDYPEIARNYLQRFAKRPYLSRYNIAGLISYPGLPVEKILLEAGLQQRALTFDDWNNGTAHQGGIFDLLYTHRTRLIQSELNQISQHYGTFAYRISS